MMVRVLILSSVLDFATDRVCRALTERGVPFVRLNREQLPEWRLTLDPTDPLLTCEHGRTWIVDGSGPLGVWFRVGTFDRNLSAEPASLMEQLQRTQWGAFMRSLMVFGTARWINRPDAVYRSEVKAVQLREASRSGFAVPATLMTNDPSIPTGRLPGATVAIKSMDTLLLREGPNQRFGYTTIVDWDALDRSGMELAPMTVQRALAPKLDLRVTVVGDRLWCVAVLADERPIDGDWRLKTKESLRYDAHELPPEVMESCHRITRALGLTYAAIDLAVSEGEYWFIEVNPTGEWGWLDGPERPIAAAIAEELTRSPR